MEKKYKLTEESIIYFGRTLYRIEALKDFDNVKKGDKGGYVQSETNLSQEDNCWVYGDAKVYDKAQISGNTKIYGNAQINSGAKAYKDSEISGREYNKRVVDYVKLMLQDNR